MGADIEHMQKLLADIYPAAAAPVAVRTAAGLTLHDPVQQRDLTLRMHMPVDQQDSPLVVFSHGSMLSPAAYDRVTLTWAQRGYTVVMPYHMDAPEQLAADPSAGAPPDLRRLLSSRIRDMSFVADAVPDLLATAGATGTVDAGKLAAAGHSFGALTAVIKLGLALKPDEYLFDDSTADPRFRAAISLSGVGPLPPFADDAFDLLTAPLLATGGTRDEGNVGAGPVFPWEWRLSPYTLAPPGDKYRLVLADADHYYGGLLGREDAAGEPDAEGLAVTLAVSTAFLDAYLQEQAAARAWLSSTDFAPAAAAARATLQTK